MAQQKIIYGIHAIDAALTHQGENVLTLYYQADSDNKRLKDVLLKAQQLAIEVQATSRAKLEKLAQSSDHQGIVAQVRIFAALAEKDIYQHIEKAVQTPLLLLLEGIQDPHNLGACLRSAQALGVDYVVVPKVHTAPLNATVSKAACGADQILPIVPVSNMVRFIEQIKERGVWVVGTAADATLNITQAALKRPLAWVMGAEGKGLKRLTLEHCDQVVKIPLVGAIESLNVSVATGVCLYETLRQRSNVFAS